MLRQMLLLVMRPVPSSTLKIQLYWHSSKICVKLRFERIECEWIRGNSVHCRLPAACLFEPKSESELEPICENFEILDQFDHILIFCGLHSASLSIDCKILLYAFSNIMNLAIQNGMCAVLRMKKGDEISSADWKRQKTAFERQADLCQARREELARAALEGGVCVRASTFRAWFSHENESGFHLQIISINIKQI